MLKIAICDDDSQFLSSFQEILKSCEAVPPSSVIHRFSSGNDLLAWYENKKECIDLIFLDVEMDGLSGLETGQNLRNMDKDVIIVFLTGFKDYVFRSFKIEPFDYLIKPPQVATVNALINRVYEKCLTLRYAITLKWKEKTCVLKASDIIYIESYHRHTTFHTEEDSFECVGQINEYASKLAPYGFLRCHQGFLVNMKYIRHINDKTILTTTGIEIEMSVRKRQHCLRTLNDYLVRYLI